MLVFGFVKHLAFPTISGIFGFLLILFISTIGICGQITDLESRALPTPFDPIFPNHDYPGPIIGAPDPILPTALTYEVWRLFPELEERNIKVYGWVEPSYNASTSSDSNIPLAFDIVPNRIELDQLVLRMERLPDTVQTDHKDVGFRLTNIFGIDYRYTIAQGIFSNQRFIQNNLYGDDPLEFYGTLYIPTVAEGMLIKVGRFQSPADIEDELATYSTFLTHSLTMTYNAYTQVGIRAIIRYSLQWTMLISFHGGNDVAPWAAGAHPSGQIMFKRVSKDNNDGITASLVSINSGQFKGDHDNLQQISITWNHRFSEFFQLATEALYMYQFNAALGGSCVFGPFKSFGGGGDGCGPTIPGLSNAFGILGTLERKVSPDDFLAFRVEYFNDPQGQRTRYATPYFNVTLGLTHVFNNILKIRPEIRYDTAFKATPFNNGERKDQTNFGIDAILTL